MKNIRVWFILLLSFSTISFAQIFSQDFSAGGAVADYASAASPNTGQWNAISTSGAGVTTSITSNALVFARAAANAGSFSRTTDFSPTPTGMMYKFTLAVSGNSAAATSAAMLQVGNAFGTANSTESNANTYARLAINFTATNGTFQLRDITNGTNSGDLSGTQDITWALNNTGATTTYTAPDASTESIANDKADVWAGTVKIFDDVAVQTATQTMTDLKFVLSGGTGSVTLDNFQIFGATDGTLPVELTSFTATAKGKNVELKWNTATETNNSGFEIEKNISGSWSKIGFVEGSGTSNAPKSYSFVDASAKGTVSYRLKQIDRDGKFEYSKTVEATVAEVKLFGLEQNYPNPFNPLTVIRYQISENRHVTLKVVDVIGREVATLVNETKEAGTYSATFDGSSLSSGIYFYTLQAGNFTATKKLTLMK